MAERVGSVAEFVIVIGKEASRRAHSRFTSRMPRTVNVISGVVGGGGIIGGGGSREIIFADVSIEDSLIEALGVR